MICMIVMVENDKEYIKESIIGETVSLIKNSMKQLLKMKDQIPEEKMREILDKSSNTLKTFMIDVNN